MSGRDSSGFGTPRRALTAARLLGLLVGVLATSEAVRRLVTPPLRGLVDGAATGDVRPWDQSLATVLAAGCAAALALAWLWLLLCGALVAAGALRRGDLVAARLAGGLGCPAWVRALVLAVLGLAVGAGPALADAPGRPAPGLAGLALPDRVAAAPAARRAPSRTAHAHRLVRVRPGDTLWAIAARQLSPASTDPEVDRAWHRLAAANTDRVGNPDLIFPGTVLRVPDLDRPSRKEPS